jgi:hypothetical protein
MKQESRNSFCPMDQSNQFDSALKMEKLFTLRNPEENANLLLLTLFLKRRKMHRDPLS